MAKENSWPEGGLIHTSTYPSILSGGILKLKSTENHEGGPGSGPHANGGGAHVIAHYDYQGDRYRSTGGIRTNKSRDLSNPSPKTSSGSPSPQTSLDIKKKNDAELARRRASMYQSSIKRGGVLNEGCCGTQEADSGSAHSAVLRSGVKHETY